MKIDIKMPSLAKQVPTEVIYSYLEINKDHLFYCLEFHAEEWINEEDEALGKDIVFNLFNITAMKDKISGIELSQTIKPVRYKIIIPTTGFDRDISIYFKKREEAQDLHDKIKKWLLNGE